MSEQLPLDAAIAAWRAGDRTRAERLARRAVAVQPDAPDALQILGACAAARGAWTEAADRFGRAAAARPGDGKLRYNHGEALRQAGRAGEAIDAFRGTLAAIPDHVPALVTLAHLLAAGGRFADAAGLLDRAVALAPQDAKARLTRGEVGLALDRADALDDLRRACVLAPEAGHAHVVLGHALARYGAAEEADAVLAKALALDPGLADAHVDRGKLAMMRDDAPAAIGHYRSALAIAPNDPQALALLAQAQRDLRRDDDARQSIAQALAVDPANALARLVEAQMLRAKGATETARDRLTALLDAAPEPHIAVEALTELGHALDRLGDYRGAFARFSQANALNAQDIAGERERRRMPARIAAVRAFASDRPGKACPATDPAGRAPTFLVGFPRSGTTLAEQILASHGAFATSDEAPLVDRVLRRLDPAGDDATRGLGALTPQQIAGLRDAYWQEAGARFPALEAGKRLVDKQPWNLVELPFIARLFPAARVIVMLRDPRDACLSAFMQYFRLNPGTLHLLTLDDTVALYEVMMGLWADWRDNPPLASIELRYEDLVDDFDGSVGRLLEFLGVPWTDAVRDYRKTAGARFVRTPSRDAVTGPVSRDAVGRWRNYAAELAPLLPRLEPFVRLFGYDRS